tara:strand:- start:474 stop:1106 length:633 start_codon:yes stop_codon:yes gene_type:complete
LIERKESLLEKKLNFITHGIGLVLSVIGLFYLVEKSILYPKSFNLISSLVYGISLILMYSSSTIYHYYIDSKYSRVLQKIDHISIYLLIAGSYTPGLLLKLKYSLGFEILIIIWLLAFIGIIHKIFFFNYLKKASLIIYLFMGWLIVIDFNAVLESFSSNSIFFMVLGGILYTIGTFFYSLDKLKYNHVIWHLFVLGGSACHYILIMQII